MIVKGLVAIVSAVLIGAVLTPAAKAADHSEAIKAASAASLSWLQLVDKGDYAGSYEQACALFKNSITADHWAASIGPARKPLGAVISRKLKSADYATTMPGAPDGEYVVVQYDTSFENKKSAVETVTPMLDKDGHWRVSGYYIK